ncbi:hypothetical protein [Nocardiopsis rhodophaea]
MSMTECSFWNRTLAAIAGTDRVLLVPASEGGRGVVGLGTRTMAAVLGTGMPPARGAAPARSRVAPAGLPRLVDTALADLLTGVRHADGPARMRLRAQLRRPPTRQVDLGHYTSSWLQYLAREIDDARARLLTPGLDLDVVRDPVLADYLSRGLRDTLSRVSLCVRDIARVLDLASDVAWEAGISTPLPAARQVVGELGDALERVLTRVIDVEPTRVSIVFAEFDFIRDRAQRLVQSHTEVRARVEDLIGAEDAPTGTVVEEDLGVLFRRAYRLHCCAMLLRLLDPDVRENYARPDIQRAQECFAEVRRECGEFFATDLREVDLRGIDLGGVRWGQGTLWPPEHEREIRDRSRLLDDGVFEISEGVGTGPCSNSVS